MTKEKNNSNIKVGIKKGMKEMNLKNKVMATIIVSIISILVIMQNISYATTLETGKEVYMGITELMNNDTPNIGYAINTPGTGNGAKIWNILRYKSSTSSEYEKANIYCVKAGVGFTQTDNGTIKRAPYDVFYDMKTERDSIKAQNEILKDLVERNITEGSITFNRYDAILAVLDMLYLPGESTQADKTDLINEILNYAMQPANGYTDYVELMESYPLTDDDIKAVQQAVLWYFTNYGENNNKYDKTDAKGWLNYTLDGTTYKPYSNYRPNGLQEQYDAGQARSYQAEVLYNHMIQQAKTKANEYTNIKASSGLPVKVETKTLQSETSGSNCIIGPILITKSNETPYTIDFEVKNNDNKITNYQLLDENKNAVTAGTTIKNLVGKNFYVSMPKDQVGNIKLNFTINYNDTTMKLWASNKNNQEQPLVEINKGKQSVPVELVLIPEKPFDLALRKYITKVNDVVLEGESSRIPNIDETTLSSGTTATYKHKKDPIIIKTGDKVTYKMTIYNEGQKQGRATKVVDQLPTGLQFSKVVSGNFELDTYEQTTNTLNLKRKSDNAENLAPYTPGNLDSETIEIECIVTEKPDTQKNKVLTNVAWISEEFDAESEEIITNEKNKDRDSEPGTKPDVDKDNMEDYKGNGNKEDLTDKDFYYKGQQDDDDFEKLVLLPQIFDLALRKYITKVNDVVLEGESSRIPNIDETTLSSGTTATYKHKKDPIIIKTGDKVTYKMTIYNEGQKQGRATKVVDQLPTGLQFSKVVSGNFELDTYEQTTNTLNLKRKSDNAENLAPYTPGNLDSETIEIECIVTEKPDTQKNKVLTNVAWISEEFDAESEEIITNEKNKDRDSEPGTKPDVDKDNMEDYKGNGNKEDLTDKDFYYKGQQDDDDFEKLILLPETFDLKLIKRITEVNNKEVPERIQSIDASKLNTLDANGKLVTTADYKLNKEPVSVKKGDIVTYTFRIYNEGTIDGYAQEITEDIPEGLQFIWSEKEGEDLKNDTTLTAEEKEAIEFNQKYLWGKFVYDETKQKIIQISSDYLSKENETTVGENLIKAFGENDGTKTEKDLSYKEISVKLKVVAEDKTGTPIRNEAEISEDCDENGDPIDDRDSDTEDWKPHPDHEDDEDHDYIILQSFDLALRKFIIAISDDTKIEDKEYLKDKDGSYKREPVVDTSKLNTVDSNGNLITTAIYNHTKEPVLVKQKDIVVYMLRVYNEGEQDGYAAEIKDHLPPYLEYVDDEFNKQYGWEVSSDGRTVTTKYLENSLINKPTTDENGKITLNYKEVPIMCRVSENAKTSENITNIADITKYLDENKQPVEDRDSEENNVKLPEDKDLPGYKENEKDSYVPGQQDDDDFEKVIIKVFDLALRKWVTQAIVIEDGKQTITQTGHDAWDDPEAVVKVELHRKKLNQVTVKFRYSIRVINQGEIAGYAKEVTDYIPEGLKFVAEDNPGWTDEGNNVISTRLLENTLLQPGESAEVEVLLTWVNSQNNMGVMNNIAEISEDYNEYDVPDIDSTPDNQKPGEDDIDDAPVMLSISTGQARIYFGLGFVVLITIAGGIILIKRYVL